jgi:glycosyltransferase involved in cell wall biosynthesis
VRVHSLGKEAGATRWSRQLRLQALLRRLLLREKSADVILCHMCPEYAVAAYPLARAAGVPLFLWYTHGHTSVWLRLAHRAVNGILTASRESFPFPSPKLVATGHGIDLVRFQPREPAANDRKVVLSIGRLSPIKAHEVPIRALAVLTRERRLPEVELRIVGTVPMPSQQWYRDELQRIVASEGLEGRVRFIGAVPHAEVERHLAACDVLVSASKTGSLDKVPLEGMACGRVVLACGAAFRDEMSGFEEQLLFRQDDPVDLADKLSEILRADRGRLAAIAQQLSENVRKRHDVDLLVDRMVGVLGSGVVATRE